MSENEFLETKVRGLEQENRTLRSTLWDQYFSAAITGLLANNSANPVEQAALIAEQMMQVRNGRMS